MARLQNAAPGQVMQVPPVNQQPPVFSGFYSDPIGQGKFASTMAWQRFFLILWIIALIIGGVALVAIQGENQQAVNTGRALVAFGLMMITACIYVWRTWWLRSHLEVHSTDAIIGFYPSGFDINRDWPPKQLLGIQRLIKDFTQLNDMLILWRNYFTFPETQWLPYWVKSLNDAFSKVQERAESFKNKSLAGIKVKTSLADILKAPEVTQVVDQMKTHNMIWKVAHRFSLTMALSIIPFGILGIWFFWLQEAVFEAIKYAQQVAP